MNTTFTYNYQMAKLAWSLNDNSFDKIFAAPLPPVNRKQKSISSPMTNEEVESVNVVLLEMGFKTI